MKNPLFQLIASGIALGMMGGSVTIHSLHVAGAKKLNEDPEWSAPSGSEPALVIGSNIATAAAVGRPGAPPADREQAATVEALEEIVSRLQELKLENKNLRGQLEETNRDVMGMMFRLDSHSESFRPLPPSSGSLFEGALDSGTSLHPLLPPK